MLFHIINRICYNFSHFSSLYYRLSNYGMHVIIFLLFNNILSNALLRIRSNWKITGWTFYQGVIRNHNWWIISETRTIAFLVLFSVAKQKIMLSILTRRSIRRCRRCRWSSGRWWPVVHPGGGRAQRSSSLPLVSPANTIITSTTTAFLEEKVEIFWSPRSYCFKVI